MYIQYNLSNVIEEEMIPFGGLLGFTSTSISSSPSSSLSASTAKLSWTAWLPSKTSSRSQSYIQLPVKTQHIKLDVSHNLTRDHTKPVLCKREKRSHKHLKLSNQSKGQNSDGQLVWCVNKTLCYLSKLAYLD